MSGSTLIGYTGFVGGNLDRQAHFHTRVNRANLHELRGHTAGLVVCAAAPAAKWLANRHPRRDRSNLDSLVAALDGVTAERFVLISTVDVYPDPVGVDEDDGVDDVDHHAYGRHRRLLERYVEGRFSRRLVVRLPALFGEGLKKNFIYDLHLDRAEVALTHRDSQFQFYDVARLWTDLERLLSTDLELVNLVTEPVQASTVARVAYGREHKHRTADVVRYDVRSIYADALGGANGYVQDASEVLRRLTAFAAGSRDVCA